MITVGIFEAKASLGQLVQSAAEGELVVLTRRGKPVAEIRSPGGEDAQREVQGTIAELRDFRRRLNLEPIDIAELLAEGRR